MQPKKLFVVAGNPLGFGGGIRQHRSVQIPDLNIKDVIKMPVQNNEQQVIDRNDKPRMVSIYNGTNPSLKGALVYKQGNKLYALQAGFQNKDGPQEEGFYQHLLTTYPLPQSQEFWNRKLADFVIDRYSKFDAQQTQGKNILGALCNIQTGNDVDKQCKQIISNNKDALKDPFYIKLDNNHTIAHLFAPNCNDGGQAMKIMYENLQPNEFKTQIAESYGKLDQYVQDHGIDKVYATAIGSGVYAGSDNRYNKKGQLIHGDPQTSSRRKAAVDVCNDYIKASHAVTVDCSPKDMWNRSKQDFCHTLLTQPISHLAHTTQQMTPQRTTPAVVQHTDLRVEKNVGTHKDEEVAKLTSILQILQKDNRFKNLSHATVLDVFNEALRCGGYTNADNIENATSAKRSFSIAFQEAAKKQGVTYSNISISNTHGMRTKSAIDYVGGENNLQSIINKVWGKGR